MTDRLAFIDQATYLSWRATGRAQLIQFVWVYNRPVNMDELRRFHRDFGQGFAGRLIEPSILPFGRHRWVAAPGPGEPLQIDPTRSPHELGDWIDGRSERPVDPVRGPGWHLGVLPMSDGSTAVSLVMSHCLLDGASSFASVRDTVLGIDRDFGHPAPRSRTRRAALRSDAGQTLRDLPEFARTVAGAVGFAYRRRGQISRPVAPAPGGRAVEADGSVVLPAISVLIDAADWDARAEQLGGTGYALFAGVAARLGERLGRAKPSDGTVNLLIAVSDRAGEQDRRSNAMKIATATVDPRAVAVDLSETRVAVRAALAKVRDVPDETHALLPLTPFVPRKAVRQTADLVFGDSPVSCSNVGVIPPEVARPDGADADHLLIRPVDQNVSRAAMERVGGQLVMAAGRIGDTLTIGIIGYQVGAANTREWLHDNVIRTLADFELKGLQI